MLKLPKPIGRQVQNERNKPDSRSCGIFRGCYLAPQHRSRVGFFCVHANLERVIMASLANDPGGLRRITFIDGNQKRHTLRLGKMPKTHARTILTHIGHLNVAQSSRQPVNEETARWVASIDDVLHVKLAHHGLVRPRKTASKDSLGPFLDEYIASRGSLKPNTLRNYRATRRLLVEHFGSDKLLADVTPGDADDWKEFLVAKMAGATVSREVKRARQFFRVAVRRRVIAENPFADVKGGKQENPDRFYFVTREEIAKVLDACPCSQWRLIVALTRYGGLRCPSEVLALRWGDIDWERGRMRVRSPKTEHHVDGKSRIVPIFPELLPHLNAAWDDAAKGDKYLITRYRDDNMNLRTQLLRIIWKAGLKEWPKLFQNLRSTRETELAETFPIHVVTKWIGNSESVARKHYLQVTEDHYTKALTPIPEAAHKAAHNTAQTTTVEPSTGMPERKKAREMSIPDIPGPLCTTVQVPPRGVEPLSSD